MHVEEGLLQALLDGELDETSAADARRHIDGCAQCRGQLEELRRDEQLLASVLPAIDHLVPRMGVPRRRPLRWAAAIALLLLAAGTAYAIPGSPVRPWIDRLIGRPGNDTEHPLVETGVAMAPGQHFTIVLSGRARGELTIALLDGASVDVRTRGPSDARFTAEIDRLRIEANEGPTDFLIAIPRHAPWVEVVVRGRQVFLKQGAGVTADVPANAQGRYVIRF